MYRLLNGNFRFVSTTPVSSERIELGFQDIANDYPYNIAAYRSTDEQSEAMRLGLESDVVIIGSAPDRYISRRIQQNKLTFRYSERFFKRGRWRILDPRTLRDRYLRDIRYRTKNLHMLCASAYTAADCRFIHAYPDKTYKWGYFPEVKNLDIEELVIRKKQAAVKILWVGRMIGLKHPEAAIHVAEQFAKENLPFHMDMIGDGELFGKIGRMISQKQLNHCVRLLGVLPPEQVRMHMEQANIFLFTSDQQEGWGAVLNEAMSSGCAVVANRVIGSVPFLIRNGVNGSIYNTKYTQLFKQVQSLARDIDLCEKMGREAYKTMHGLWDPGIAAKRLISLSEALLASRSITFDNGPCSRA